MACSSRADLIINEFMAAASERLLQWDANGVPRLGAGPSWYEGIFSDADWRTGAGPFGFGSLTNNPTPVGTNLGTSMQFLTPTLYLRKTFSVAAGDAARPDPLQLSVEYNDGFVAYLNGVEIARRNGGPAKKFIYHDQPAYNREIFVSTAPIPTTVTIETITLPAASSLLAPGNNLLAIHALNANADNANFYIKADLRISGTPVVNLVNFNDSWKYLPGVVEPSGTLYDPALLFSGKLKVPWGTLAFDDAIWLSGTGPLGAGNPGVAYATNLTSAVINNATSVYTRAVFNVSAVEASETQPMTLAVQFDDGFVAYINGVEVARRELGPPNTFTPHTAVSDRETSALGTTTLTIDSPSRLLVAGDNVLAIQVHNFAMNNADLLFKADLRTTGPSNRVVVANNRVWKYLVGTGEPEPEPLAADSEQDLTPEGPDSAVDWIELHNNGVADVALAGFSLTDDATKPRKWIFPSVTIPAGGYLVVVADGLDVSSPGGLIHTNFALDQDGEYVGLYNAAGTLVAEIGPAYPGQSPFHSFGREAGGSFRYLSSPTPGAANAGAAFESIVATPVPDKPGGFYTGSVAVSLSCATPGATIRYTTDGSEPTEASAAVSGAVNFTINTALRARAFLANNVPSKTANHTYLLNQSVARRSLPAVCLTGDQQRMFYRPFGIMAIVGGIYTGNIWNQNGSPLAYNASMQIGQPAERPIGLELFDTNAATPDLRTEAGIRIAGSPWSRPQYRLVNQNSATPNSASPWASNPTEKAQFNLYFRDDLGGRPLNYPLVPGSPITAYEDVRLRSGKNDISNPFIRDELCRRLMVDMGQVTVLGDHVNVYLDGVFKGYFNICQRPREKFFQEARGTSASFDVRYISAMTDGDVLAYNEIMNYAKTRNMANATDYQGMAQRLDVVNFCDYLLLNSFTAMWDWPHNNYVMDRERSPQGLWRFSIWDAEGGFGLGGHANTYNSFTSDLITGSIAGETVPARLFYTVLRQSPEFRLLFADRIQRAFFNNGGLVDQNITNRFNVLKAQVEPMIKDVFGAGTTLTNFLSGWVPNTRRTTMFAQFTGQNLWPATKAPLFSQHGGSVPVDFQLSITNPNAAGTIYYTTDGSDPRAVGGAATGVSYNGPLTIHETTRVKSRVRNTNGEWSPLTESSFTSPLAPSLIISEIMYRAPLLGAVDGDEFEFLELKNAGTTPVSLNEMAFTDGIEFAFPAGVSLAPGALLVLAKNPAQFAVKYPGVPVFGTYGPSTSLANGGEIVALRDLAGNLITSVTYDDIAPWPTGADGGGYSLVPINENGGPNPDAAGSWRASTNLGGSPGQNDPSPIATPVLINELVTNPPAGQSDAIEILNPNAQVADLSHWYLSDDPAAPKKFQFPSGATIPASGYLTIREADFNPTPGLGSSFELPQSGGRLVLSSADEVGDLTGYTHNLTFGAAARGVSFGRHLTSTAAERFVAQTATTLGAANTGPLVGPVVITEVMFQASASGDDFLEIRNITGSPVPLFDPGNPANAWRVNGISLTFPANVTLEPRQIAMLTPLSPAAFRTKYNLSDAVPVFQFDGSLDDFGELISVQMPAEPAAGQPLAYIDVDAVTYDDALPWPTSTSGTGLSLERFDSQAYGDDVANWRPSTAIGGSPSLPSDATFLGWQSARFSAAQLADVAVSGANADPDNDSLTNLWEFAHGSDPLTVDAAGTVAITLEADGAAGPFLTLRYRRNPSAQNVELHVDTAGSLPDWIMDSAVAVGPPIINSDGTETVTMRDTIPSDGAAKRFIRLRLFAP